MFDSFSTRTIETNNTTIYARTGGSGPPLLLLHGFPQTHLMWRNVAPILARAFTVVCADLRGYGSSGCPASTEDHAPYAKRTMGDDMIGLLQRLGFATFAVAGHARGGRVAYRLALDWNSGGPLDTWYSAQSGPLAIWKAWADDVRGHSLAGGHFFPEQVPEETAEALRSFVFSRLDRQGLAKSSKRRMS